MNFPGTTAEQAKRQKALASFLRGKVAASDLTVEEFAERVDTNKHTVEARLSGKTRVSIYGELQAYLTTLGISIDEVLDILYPGATSASVETSAELKECKLQLKSARDQLDDLRSSSGPELGLVRDLASTGRWAVSVSPHHAGPSADCVVLQSMRLAITPVGSARVEIEESGVSVREVFNTECGKIVRDRAIFIGDSLPDKPRAPWDVPEDHVVYMAIPLFSGDRGKLDAARGLPKFPTESIVVLSTTQGAWPDRVAALVAKALGWGLLNSSSVHRHAYPIELGPRDAFVEQMNRHRNAGLAEVLGKPHSHLQTVVHHVGRPSVDGDFEGHPLVEAAPDPHFRSRMPVIVLLSESDRAMVRQADKVRKEDGSPRFSVDQWKQWRDDLRSSVESLEVGRFIVWDIDLVDGETAESEGESQLLWQRTAEVANSLLRQLRALGGLASPSINTTGDRDALKVLRWSGY